MSYVAITMIAVGLAVVAITLVQAWVRGNALRKELQKAETSIRQEQELMLSHAESRYLKEVLEAQISMRDDA